MKVLFATSNPHKVQEVRAVLAPLGIEVLDFSSMKQVPAEPEEDQETFEGNARLKALYYAKHIGQVCLAEDSGIEVDALGGAPGVYSARYAGTSGTREERDRANNRKLLLELLTTPESERQARFVCAMCLAAPSGELLAESRGVFEGAVGLQPGGTNGFGYDPILYLPELRCTSAQLSTEEKNARSHRGAAARALAEKLKGLDLKRNR
ncbi:MAG: hypothetical protein RJA70_1889 [Pseudomonadota bacterium]|jgi:XTP/dITP diphosphohydrolase